MKTKKHALSDATSSVCLGMLEAIQAYEPLGFALRGETLSLVSQDQPDPNLYSPSEFRWAYWGAEMWSKQAFDIPGVNRETAAFEKFFEAEEQCRSANAGLTDWGTRPSIPYGVMARARRLVGQVLGDFSWDLALPHCSFGPGATTSLPRRLAARQNKWGRGLHITEQCLPLYLAFRRYHTGWNDGDRELLIVAGNKVTTVPKNAKTDRVIAVEPDWNMFFQRGIGGLLRSRVQRRLGLLTPQAQADNRRLARQGSIDGSLATIDLSSASDTVSLALCEALLPADWARAMLTVRSPQGICGEKTVVYEKISSMGNGFTFELETLLFWALTRACCGAGTVRAYGDDIICPSEYFDEVSSLLEVCGFQLNRKKSFAEGPFRESCGGHYHSGTDVTPPYFRHKINSLPEYIRAANRISRAASQQFGYVRDERFKYVWDHLARSVPRYLYGPVELGDSVLHMPFDAARPSWSRPLQQWRVKALVPTVSKVASDTPGAMFHSLWGDVAEGSWIAKASTRYRVSQSLTPRWDGPSPWLDLDSLG